MKEKERAKIIFSPQLANYLLKRGYSIIKLKPKKGTVSESVFVFREDEGFFEAVEDWMYQNPEIS